MSASAGQHLKGSDHLDAISPPSRDHEVCSLILADQLPTCDPHDHLIVVLAANNGHQRVVVLPEFAGE